MSSNGKTKFYNLDTDSTMTANSDYLIPSQKAIKKNIDDLQQGIDTNAGDIAALQADKQDKLTAGDNITIANNVISATGGGSAPDTTTIEKNTDGTISAIGVKLKSNGIKYDWEGTEAEWKAGREAGTIPDSWYCNILDDGTAIGYPSTPIIIPDNWNNIANYYRYCFVSNDGTQVNAPNNTVGFWLLEQIIAYNGLTAQRATRIDNPSIVYVRTTTDGTTWTNWALPYAQTV